MKTVAQRSSEKGLPARSDLYVADHHDMDSTKCRLLLGYSSELGTPSMRNVEDFVEYTFNGKIHTKNETAQLHKAESAVSVICTLHTSTRSLSDSSSLRKIAGDTFADDNTGHLWRVVSDGSQKFLMRQTTENIADIVAARHEKHLSRNATTFNNIKIGAPIPLVGDQVKFMSPDNVILFGEVVKLSDESAIIKANGSDIKVDRHAILEITDRSKKEIADEKDMLKDFFTKAYGSPEFAAELSSKTNKEKDGIGSTVPAAGKLEKK